jgi:hypothetical protein
MSLTRSVSGLLAINAWNGDTLPGSSTPFVSGDWTVSTGVTKTILGDGQLQLTNSNASLWYCARRDSIASRSKTFIFAQLAMGSTSGTLEPAVHITQVTTPTCAGGGFTVARGGGDQARITGTTAGTPFVIAADVPVATKLTNTGYKATFFANGTALTVRDLTGATTVTGTSATSSGQVGILFNSGGAVFVSRWIAASDRYVTVTGVPTGGSAEILTPSATTLVSAVESGGIVTLDLFGLDAATAQSIRVKDSGGTLLAIYQDTSAGASKNLIAGGDTFDYVFTPTMGRVSQTGGLIVTAGTPADRVSQTGVLTVTAGTPAERVSQVGALVIVNYGFSRVSQEGLAVVRAGSSTVRVSQEGLAVVHEGSPIARVSQEGLAIVHQFVYTARVSQEGLAVVYAQPAAVVTTTYSPAAILMGF